MSDKPRQVDMGPMYLPLGEERRHVPLPSSKALPAGHREDVERFRELMQGSRERSGPPDAVAPLSLLSRREGGEPPPAADDDEGSRCGLAAAMERLWVGEGLHGEREVRIGLRNTILPDTAVRMRLLQGRLHLELSCLEAPVARRLVDRLDALAQELGSRLDRAVVASVEHIDHGLLRCVSWFPERA